MKTLNIVVHIHNLAMMKKRSRLNPAMENLLKVQFDSQFILHVACTLLKYVTPICL